MGAAPAGDFSCSANSSAELDGAAVHAAPNTHSPQVRGQRYPASPPSAGRGRPLLLLAPGRHACPACMTPLAAPAPAAPAVLSGGDSVAISGSAAAVRAAMPAVAHTAAPSERAGQRVAQLGGCCSPRPPLGPPLERMLCLCRPAASAAWHPASLCLRQRRHPTLAATPSRSRAWRHACPPRRRRPSCTRDHAARALR